MHLESLNKLNYKMNEEKYSFLHTFENKCESYAHYFSTATSTLMVLSDLQFGTTTLFEACKSLDDVPDNLDSKESLFDELSEQGYESRVLVYPASGDISGSEARHFLGQKIKAEVISNYKKYIDEIDNVIEKDKFAIHIVPTISNVAENKVVDVSKDYGVSHWDEGYRILNRICEHVVNKLEQANKLDNTLIVFYGDHGDDYWGHGLHCGLTHAIEPNNLLISTPMFIWNGKETKPGYYESIIQTSDLRELITCYLKGNPWISNRKYAFSRNEYAAQDVRRETFNKAYSVANDRYMLLVSANGLEFYDTVMDPGCLTNILRFFKLKEGVLCIDIPKEDFKHHIRAFWNPRQQRIIRMHFYDLKDKLVDEINKTYLAGGVERNIEELQLESINQGY